jgi:hypothetical protein
MNLENRGIHTVLLCNQPFVNAAKTHARVWGGYDDWEVVETPHPWPVEPEALTQLADAVFETVVTLLTGSGTEGGPRSRVAQ